MIYTLNILYCKSTEDIFAANVNYHGNCFRYYFKKFDQDIDNILKLKKDDTTHEEHGVIVKDAFDSMVNTLDIKRHEYDLSVCREIINKTLSEYDKNSFIVCKKISSF